MPLTTRRAVLRRGGALSIAGLAVFTGCLRGGNDPATATDSCTASEPPKPSNAAGTPRSYPSKPDELTAETVVSFAAAYEKAYRYNEALAEYPDKMGRTNDADISIQEPTADAADGGYAVEVSGQVNYQILDATETPETPTETPLPMAHQPFETAYVVTDRRLRREGVVVECW